MKLQHNVYYNLIYNCKSTDFETGGILGGNNNIISEYLFDDNEFITDRYAYIPNRKFLNFHIEKWNYMGIELMGMFHTHISGGTYPSNADLVYFERLIHAAGKPLVFIIINPNITMSIYKAKLIHNQFSIQLEKVELIY
ncbi:MAG: Mov34/MPN/PAD-1 family protein [Eubacterium sp.]